MRRLPFAFLPFLFVLATAVPAAAFDLPSPQRVTSRHEEPRAYDVDSDADGNAYATWTSQPRPRNGTGARVRFARLDDRGRPEEVLTLGVLTLGRSRRVGSLVATDPSGHSTVVWQTRRGGSPRLLATQVSASGRPGPVLDLTRDGGSVAPFSVHVEAAADGSTFVSWAFQGVHVVRIAPNGQPGTARTVTTGCVAGAAYDDGPDLAIDPAGGAVLAWQECDPPSLVSVSVHFARVDADGDPSAPVKLAEGGGYDPPRIAVDGAGFADVVYSDVQTGSLVRVAPNGTFAGPVPLGAYRPLTEAVTTASGSVLVGTSVSVPPAPGGNTERSAPAVVPIDADGSVGDVRRLAHVMVGGLEIDSADGRTIAAWNARREGHGSVIRVAKVGAEGRPLGVAGAGPGFGSAVSAANRRFAVITMRYAEHVDSLWSVVGPRR